MKVIPQILARHNAGVVVTREVLRDGSWHEDG